MYVLWQRYCWEQHWYKSYRKALWWKMQWDTGTHWMTISFLISRIIATAVARMHTHTQRYVPEHSVSPAACCIPLSIYYFLFKTFLDLFLLYRGQGGLQLGVENSPVFCAPLRHQPAGWRGWGKSSPPLHADTISAVSCRDALVCFFVCKTLWFKGNYTTEFCPQTSVPPIMSP